MHNWHSGEETSKLLEYAQKICYHKCEQISRRGLAVKDLTAPYVSFIVLFAAVTAVLGIQRWHTTQDILAYLTFVFIVMYLVHRR